MSLNVSATKSYKLNWMITAIGAQRHSHSRRRGAKEQRNVGAGLQFRESNQERRSASGCSYVSAKEKNKRHRVEDGETGSYDEKGQRGDKQFLCCHFQNRTP